MMKPVTDDTVSSADPEISMEDILARDQRTTSHRVLDRIILQSNCCTAAKSTSSSATFPLKASSTKRCCGRTILPSSSTSQHHRPGVTAARIERNDRAQRHSNCCCCCCCCCCCRCCDSSCLVPAFYQDDRGIRARHNAPLTATTWLRLGSLLVTLLVVSVHGAPTMTLEDRRLSLPPKWVNPCGLAAEDFDGDPDVVQLRDDQLLHQVVVQAKTALVHAELFRDDYARRTHNLDFADLHSMWKDNHYDWLPGPNEIPKQLGEQLDQEYLDKLELDTALLDAYEYMQKYAVGLEQIVWDQEDQRLEFRKQFKDTEFNLRTVLCELQVALVERGVTPRPDVSREVMSSEYRAVSSSETYRNLRDWMIFRDYMNGLEYLVQVFEHLRRGLES